MEYYQLTEDENSDDIVLLSPEGEAIKRFRGNHALQHAIEWAQKQNLPLDIGFNLSAIVERFQFPPWLHSRFARVNRFQNSSDDPPNVRRVIVPNYDDFSIEDYLEDIEKQSRGADSKKDDELILAPTGDAASDEALDEPDDWETTSPETEDELDEDSDHDTES